jgi:hypothetical protein
MEYPLDWYIIPNQITSYIHQDVKIQSKEKLPPNHLEKPCTKFDGFDIYAVKIPIRDFLLISSFLEGRE